MSALIHQFVVHRLNLSDDGKLHFIPRSTCFEASKEIESLAQQLHATYNSKPGKGVGGFSEENENSFADDLSQVLQSDMDFHEFSVKSGEFLLQTLAKDEMVEIGFLIFSQYEYLATQYLLIALIDTKQHVAVNKQMDLDYSDHLDFSKMQLAVRIDITQWQVTPEQFRYISFLKGRMGRRVSDFFMHYIGCEEKVDVKQQNKQLMQNVDDYLSHEQCDAYEKNQHRGSVATYFKEKVSEGEDVTVDEIAQFLPQDEDAGQSFSAFNDKQESPLEPSFQPDRAVIKSLAKFSGAGGGVTLNFDRQLLGERILYDPNTDTLTIRGIPPNLKDQLLRANKGN
jgi:nucleoid-associated protein